MIRCSAISSRASVAPSSGLAVGVLVEEAQQHELDLGLDLQAAPAPGVVGAADQGPVVEAAGPLRGAAGQVSTLLPVEAQAQFVDQVEAGPGIEVTLQVGLVDVAVLVEENSLAD